MRFLAQFDKRGECRSVEYGGSWWLGEDYEDLNRAMIEEASRYIPALIEQASGKAKEADLDRSSETGSKTRLRDPARMKRPDLRPAWATNQLSRGEGEGQSPFSLWR